MSADKTPETISFLVHVDVDPLHAVNPRQLATAIYRAIEYAMDNDIRGAEALNRGDCGQIGVDLIPVHKRNP